MAKLTIGQKAGRALKFLLGLRLARVFSLLTAYGFTAADRDEGWARLKALTEGKLSYKPVVKNDPQLVELLDQWENRWFPVASATLRARFPDVHAWLFLNLAQTEGAEVVVSVSTFVDRITRMVAEAGPNAAAARTLLEERGLTAAAANVATDILKQLGTTTTEAVAAIDPEAQAQAEAALWEWYLEWSAIARVAIRDRKILRDLGFLNAKRPVGDPSEEGGREDEVTEEAAQE